MPASSERIVRVAVAFYGHPDGTERLALRGEKVALMPTEERRLDGIEALEPKPVARASAVNPSKQHPKK